jgi:hypothetical protein
LSLGAFAALSLPNESKAHHSFAVFFDETRLVRIEGTVKRFRYSNPHASIVVTVAGSSGEQHDWRIETTSPSILSRRGWTRTSLKPGDRVSVEGWLARDGSRYLRLRELLDANGNPVGSGAFGTGED